MARIVCIGLSEMQVWQQRNCKSMCKSHAMPIMKHCWQPHMRCMKAVAQSRVASCSAELHGLGILIRHRKLQTCENWISEITTTITNHKSHNSETGTLSSLQWCGVLWFVQPQRQFVPWSGKKQIETTARILCHLGAHARPCWYRQWALIENTETKHEDRKERIKEPRHQGIKGRQWKHICNHITPCQIEFKQHVHHDVSKATTGSLGSNWKSKTDGFTTDGFTILVMHTMSVQSGPVW